MPKTPPEDDEQAEQQSDYRESPRQVQRQRRVRLPEQVAHLYPNDEHTEIPKIRRASLYTQDGEEDIPARTLAARARRRRESEERTRQRRAISDHIGTRSRRAVSDDAAKVKHTRPTTNTTVPRRSVRRNAKAQTPIRTEKETPPARKPERITITQRRRPTAYEPPPAHARIQERQARKPVAPSNLWQWLLNNQPLMLIGLIVIIMLILMTIASSMVQNKPNQVHLIVGGSSEKPSSGATGVQSKDPHAITIAPTDTTHPAPPVYAASAYLLDADTGETLYAYNAFAHRPMLSTTKLMTALLAVEKGNLDQPVTITNAIQNDLNGLSGDSSLMGIKKDETYTLRDLLYGAMLVSGNDAALAIADTIGGNQSQFVAMMNQRAHELGLNDTHYMNPHGLITDGHYSCAHDLAILGKVDFAQASLRQIMGTREYHITQSSQHADHDMFNGDQFQWWYPGVDGGKPGWDGANNYNQVISVTRNHHHLIGVTMGTMDWWTDMRDLMNWGFNDFNWISPYDVDLQHPIPYDTDWNFFTQDKKENTIPTPDHGRYYIFTGYSITGLILTYFDKNGGLRQFGYPRSLPQADSSTLSERFDHGAIVCDLKTKVCRAAA